MQEAFYIPDGDGYASTELTRGPWDPSAQHAGPPVALIGRAVERAGGLRGGRVARLTVELLRPIPIAPLAVQTEVVRAGRTAELVEATLWADHAELARARAWRVLARAVEVDSPDPDPPPDPPEHAAEEPFFSTGQEIGYHTAMEVRFTAGAFRELGPATAWFRAKVPIVAEEDPSPLERVLVAADSGNGISAALDYDRFRFVNADLSVNLVRHPVGEWVRLDSVTLPNGDGVGLTDTALHDREGRIGRGTQTLVIAER